MPSGALTYTLPSSQRPHAAVAASEVARVQSAEQRLRTRTAPARRARLASAYSSLARIRFQRLRAPQHLPGLLDAV